MVNQDSKVKYKIINNIIYNSIILMIFLFWFSYSTFDSVITLFLISLSIFLLIFTLICINYIKVVNIKILPYQGLLTLIPILFLINIFLFYTPYNPPFFFAFHDLIGIRLHFQVLIFLVLLSIVFLKLIGIYFYFIKNPLILEAGSGDEIFQFFARDLNFKKISLVVLLFPSSALVEELIYRSLLLSFFVVYFNLNIIIGIIIISIIFGLVHLSTSRNWGHVISTLISSIIYFIALIELGLWYAWFFHLATNVLVIYFYNHTRKKNL
ncbi:MAG: type II CAAX prenyl endopeptidase Rce1 family protein [Promethearchaeota archaeon]